MKGNSSPTVMTPRTSILSRWARSMRPWLAAAAVAVLAAGSWGCGSKPTMHVEYARVTSVNPMGIGMDVTVRVYNPNSFDVRVREVRVTTTLADTIQLPWMRMQPNVWLPAKKTVAVTVPTVIPWPQVPQILAATMGSEEISYHVVGEADIAATRTFGIHVNHEKVDERGKVRREMILSAARTFMPGVR